VSDLSRILDPVELFAFLVESVEVVVQVEIESRHGSVSAAAIWLQKMILV